MTPAIAPMDMVFGMQEYGESSQIMCAFFLWYAHSALPTSMSPSPPSRRLWKYGAASRRSSNWLGSSCGRLDRKSTRLNSSHRCISYAVFCLKKKIERVRADPDHVDLVVAEVVQVLLDAADLGGADEGEVQRIPIEDMPHAGQIPVADLLMLSLDVGHAAPLGLFLADHAHRSLSSIRSCDTRTGARDSSNKDIPRGKNRRIAGE